MADNSQILSAILSASCNKCGASLELPPGLRFATCQFCGSRLEVRFTGGVVFTEVLDASADGDRQIAHDLQLIKLQNELNRLDQEWNLERERYRIHAGRGGSYLPGSGAAGLSILGGIAVIGFGAFWTATALSRAAPDAMVFFGVMFLIFAACVVIYTCVKQGQYTTAVERYESRRQQLLSNLRQFEGRERNVTPVAQESASP